jgi:hypothetical protein
MASLSKAEGGTLHGSMVIPMPDSTLYFPSVCKCNLLKNKSNSAKVDNTHIITSAPENQEESCRGGNSSEV